MNDFIALMKKRRSIRKYKNTPVEKEKLDSLTAAALLTPSSRGAACTDFIIVDDKDALEKLSSCRPHGSQFLKNAQAAVVVAADTSVTDVWIENASIAAMNLLLSAEDAGLGACWIQVRNREHSPGISTEKYILELLSIPEGRAVECIISIGYPDETLPEKEPGGKDFARIHRNQF